MADLPTLDAIHKRSKVPLRHLVKLQEMGYIAAQKPDKTVSAILVMLRKRKPLTLHQSLALYLMRHDIPKVLSRYHVQIGDILDTLGDIQAQGAPWSISGRVGLAAGHDVESVAILAQWARSTLSTLPTGFNVPYAWLACRLLINAPAHQMPLLVRSMIKASRLMRAHPAMAGCWHKVEGYRVAYHSPLTLDL